MAKSISKKSLKLLYIASSICVITNIIETIWDFQSGKNFQTFEGWGDILGVLFWIVLPIVMTVKYRKDKEKEKGEDKE